MSDLPAEPLDAVIRVTECDLRRAIRFALYRRHDRALTNRQRRKVEQLSLNAWRLLLEQPIPELRAAVTARLEDAYNQDDE